MADTLCLNTTVVNVSSIRRYFDFLPPYGLSLDPGQEYTYPGTIPEWIKGRSTRPDQIQTYMKTYDYVLKNNMLAIKSTPATIVYDTTAAATKMIDADNNQLRMSPPCYVTGGPAPIVVGP